MKRLAIISFGFIASCVFVFSCSQQEKATPEKEKSVMYEASELALLMRAMHEQSAQWKKALENEEISLQFPSGYHKLFTAEPTNPAEIDEKFHHFAQVFLQETEAFTSAPIHLQREQFNIMIQSCITCHESYCRGPIQKISKLKIE
jgi:cytochrome c556